MRISTKGRYGLQIMLDLTMHQEQGFVSLASVAKRQDLSANYLEQVMAMLRKAGLVRSIKGKSGGYCLAKAPARISVGEILRVLEGDLLVTDPVQDKGNCVVYCLDMRVWQKLNQGIAETVDSITLADLMDHCRSYQQEQAQMYYI